MTDEKQQPPDFSGRYFRMQNEAIDIYAARIGPIALAIFALLCRFAHNKTGIVDPVSAAFIGRCLGCGRTQVFRGLKALEQHQLLVRRYTGRGNRYQVLNLRHPVRRQHSTPPSESDSLWPSR